MIEILNPDFIYTDERGTLTQLVHSGYNQINAVVTKAGARRGRMHYHKKNSEAFFVISGKVEYHCQSMDRQSHEVRVFSAGEMWQVSPNIGHDFFFLEDTVMVSMYTIGMELPDGSRDIIEMEKII